MENVHLCLPLWLWEFHFGGLWGLQVLLTVCRGFIPDELRSEINMGSVTMSHSLQSQTNIRKCILASASLTSNWYLRCNNLELIIVKELEIAIIFSLCEERGKKWRIFHVSQIYWPFLQMTGSWLINCTACY